MSPAMLTLARSQDTIGWKLFMEGNISTLFYQRQQFHLTMSSSYLNGTDWTKQLISRLLNITHSQWIYRNISLHSNQGGRLHKEKVEQMREEIEELLEIEPGEIPAKSQFLLDISLEEITSSHTETQAYWIKAVNAARQAKARERALKATKARGRGRSSGKVASRTNLGITATEQQIRSDNRHRMSQEEYRTLSMSTHQTTLNSIITSWPHPASVEASRKSNRRLRKPD